MRNNLERRVTFDKESWDIYNQLILEDIFKDLSIMEMFAIAMVYGIKQGFKTKLKKDKVGRVRKTTIDNSDVHYMMMAIAVKETGSLDILANRNDYFIICEEYAKTGLIFLQSDFISKGDKILEDFEFDALQFFDEKIG